MKKQMSLFVWAAAVFGMAVVITSPSVANTSANRGGFGRTGPGFHGASVIDTSGPAAVKIQNNIFINTRPPRSHTVQHGEPMYYVSPNRRGQIWDDFNDDCGDNCETTAPQPIIRSEAARARFGKLRLTHPFFQPEEGRVGSVTSLGHARNTFSFEVPVIENPGIAALLPPVWFDGESGAWRANQTFIKQDLAYGINDRVAVVGNIKFGSTKVEMDWDAPDLSADKDSHSQIDQAGVGVLWRFYEDADYIANIGAMYQWTKTNNAIALDGKFGRKIGNSTIYALGRAWGISWDDAAYGVYIEDLAKGGYYIVFNQDVPSMLFNFEAGAGIFSALDENWSVGAELVFGDYDWHSQAGISAHLNYQPSETFAIGLFGRMSVWDSAQNNDNIEMWWLDPVITLSVPVFVGRTELSKYSDMMFGARMFLYF
jgi:hypothetical protein